MYNLPTKKARVWPDSIYVGHLKVIIYFRNISLQRHATVPNLAELVILGFRLVHTINVQLHICQHS